MANLIDTSFFFGTLAIAQIEQESVRTDVANYIAQYEPILLTALLGSKLYADLVDAPTPDVNFDPLKYGEDYMSGLGIEHWFGLISDTPKKSLIANYVYCRYAADNASYTSGTGEKIAKAENGVIATPKYKIANAWNEMIAFNRELYKYLTYTPYFQTYTVPYTAKLFSPINVWF
jgi:hypothetical protein